jgi:hypothetical protein
MKNRSRWLGFVLGLGLSLVSTSVVSADDDARYKIVMSKKQQLCTQVRDVLNADLAEYGPGYDPRKFAAPIFSAIAWTPIGLDEGFDYAGAVARVDINNDGTEDVVVRQETSGGKDITFMRLFIFGKDQYPELAKKRSELADNSVGSVDLFQSYGFLRLPQKAIETPGPLKGKKYYEGFSEFVYIHPLHFDKRSYLLLTVSPDSRFVPNWALVANYKQGKVREADPALMDDLCYLKVK